MDDDLEALVGRLCRDLMVPRDSFDRCLRALGLAVVTREALEALQARPIPLPGGPHGEPREIHPFGLIVPLSAKVPQGVRLDTLGIGSWIGPVLAEDSPLRCAPLEAFLDSAEEFAKTLPPDSAAIWDDLRGRWVAAPKPEGEE